MIPSDAGRAPAQGAVMRIDRFPDSCFDGGHSEPLCLKNPGGVFAYLRVASNWINPRIAESN